MFYISSVKNEHRGRDLTLSWISSLIVGFLLVERGTLSHLTRGFMVRPYNVTWSWLMIMTGTESVMAGFFFSYLKHDGEEDNHNRCGNKVILGFHLSVIQ